MQKGGHFRISSENISFLMKNVDMSYFKKRAYGIPTWQWYSYATCRVGLKGRGAGAIFTGGPL